MPDLCLREMFFQICQYLLHILRMFHAQFVLPLPLIDQHQIVFGHGKVSRLTALDPQVRLLISS